jgi:Lantibiotic dehydratase, N terminus
MPYAAAPTAEGVCSGTDGRGCSGSDGYAVHLAPYALVRSTVLRHPAQSPPAAAFRAELALLAALEAETAALLPELCDALYAGQGGHSTAFHRDVVLPLRRALHNRREPRPALLDRLGDLPRRVPQLAVWLALRRRRADLLARLDTTSEAALVAEREALSTLCREPALGRAVALTSSDLLRAVERAGAGAHDRKARKEEPGVLRHVLRASTRTSPLSWFTAVGWGRLPTAVEPLSAVGPADWGTAGLPVDALTSVVKTNRTLVTALSEALLDDPRRRAGLPHRMTSSARIIDGRATYARSRVVFAGGRYLVTTEDEVALTARGPLALVAASCETASTLGELADALAAALQTHGGAESHAAAEAFLRRLTEANLLVPTEPVDPQGDDPLARLSDLLKFDEPSADGESLAFQIDALADLTREFANTEATRRPPLLADLSARWHTLLADAGRPVPTDAARLSVLSEDVVAPEPVQLDGLLGGADHQALTELTALAELFDLGQLMRRTTRDRFVARYGIGGCCPHLWEFGGEFAQAWEDAGRLAALAPGDQSDFPTGGAELASLRASLVESLRSGGGSRSDESADADVVLPADLVRGLGDRLPRWMVRRPLSYSYFLQRGTRGDLLCVNHVYGGWGRFTSRFLDAMAPAAGAEVARQIHRGLGEGARAAQFRPVGGFNANLHPLLVADEIGPDRRWTPFGEAELDLVHDEASDQVRLRLRATGELLDVLYNGFLAPTMLPQRIAPLLSDHPLGVIDFRALVPQYRSDSPGGRVIRTPRLRYRHLVLRRRRWHLDAGVVQALRADLADEPGLPLAATARWRTLLQLPEQVFLHPAPAPLRAGHATEDFLAQISRPKPQFVDLGNALHLRSLAKWLSRHPDGAVLEEALPAPGGREQPASAVELVAEVYRAGRTT